MGTAKKTQTTTNVLDLLTSQHEEVDGLFEKLEAEEGDQAALFVELADKLAAHAAVEEQIFYPAVMTKETGEQLHEAVEEHLQMKRLLADLMAMQVGTDEFKAKIAVLKENVAHHAHEEEEGKLFPILRREMSEDQLAGLGNEVLARFEKLLPMHPSRHIPAETKTAASLPPVE